MRKAERQKAIIFTTGADETNNAKSDADSKPNGCFFREASKVKILYALLLYITLCSAVHTRLYRFCFLKLALICYANWPMHWNLSMYFSTVDFVSHVSFSVCVMFDKINVIFKII